MKYKIRELRKCEYPLLADFLYEAIFQRDGNNLISKEIIRQPDLQRYIKDFGSEKDDYCLCAEVENKIVGAVWVRCIAGYGSVDKNTPELAISLYKDYRGKGIGTDLIKHMISLLRVKGYQQTSLSVQKDNYAAQMYLKLGYEIIDENEEEFIMISKIKRG